MTLPPFLVSLERLLTNVPQSSTLVFRAFLGCAGVMAFVASRMILGFRPRQWTSPRSKQR